MKLEIRYILAILQLFIAFMAIPAGISFIVSSDGSGMGMSLEILSESPFTSFLIPGVILLIIIGLGHLFGSLNTFRNEQTSGLSAFLLGVALFIWLGAQVWYIGLIHFLQFVFVAIAFIEILLAIYQNHEKGIF